MARRRLRDSPLGAALGVGIETKPKAERTTFSVGVTVGERVRDCCYWERISTVKFVEETLLAEIDRRERERGKVYGPRTGPLSRRG